MATKTKVRSLTPEDYPELRQHVEAKIKAYIAAHPGCDVRELASTKQKGIYPVTTPQFVMNNTICTQCGHIEEKAGYAIAQTAMGHAVYFTCDCGNRFKV